MSALSDLGGVLTATLVGVEEICDVASFGLELLGKILWNLGSTWRDLKAQEPDTENQSYRQHKADLAIRWRRSVPRLSQRTVPAKTPTRAHPWPTSRESDLRRRSKTHSGYSLSSSPVGSNHSNRAAEIARQAPYRVGRVGGAAWATF